MAEECFLSTVRVHPLQVQLQQKSLGKQANQADELNLSLLAVTRYVHTHTHRVLIQAPRRVLHMSIHEQQSSRIFVD